MDATSFRLGLRAGVPFGAASFLLSLSFGVLARETGFSPTAALVMSALVFAGSAQFASVAILAGGGGAPAAIAAAGLMNSRFLPMGLALAPSLPGNRWWRAAQGQAVVDSSWALAMRPDGSFDRWFLFGTTAPQYVAWLAGTATGAWGGRVLPDPATLGLDAVYPAFFLAILAPELRRRRGAGVAAGGAVLAFALVPFSPPGVPILVAGAAALWGLRPPPAPRIRAEARAS
ncbi:putative azaleucine resistance protein AzlC [Aeromicrobium marinum DSM 15272]|uniref:Azaleucine resistance protein AzlC n=1 Tax=Aeromicrobium marinum DSM 15272 TaxID=585531 RepID=E2SCN8_9ACTN|nr:AzlC family ABC transporter permease [Aeromicrobium marinum]EFQ82991.1 putative azaleucine resistance protein AzlC [Aeromicrobium marinum DSM 15272]